MPTPIRRIPAAASRRRKKLLSAFPSAFRTPDLRKKLLFTVAIIAVYRLGATLPSPGVSYGNVQNVPRQSWTSGDAAAASSRC